VAQECVTSVSGGADSPPVPKSRSVTLKTPIPRASESASAADRPSRPVALPAGIVRDAVYPNMCRLVRLYGTLSDMVNLTRAKDAVRDGRGIGEQL
jgi:hypothetical protein